MKTEKEECMRAVAQCMAAGHYQAAARICNDHLSSSPADIPLLAMLTAACEQAGDDARAREAARRWVEAAPLDSYAHYKLAMIEQRLRNYPAASERLQIAASVAGPDEEVCFAVRDALRALDAIQLPQVMALREVDAEFRAHLRFDPDTALAQRGFALSADAKRELRYLDEGFSPRPAGRPQLLS